MADIDEKYLPVVSNADFEQWTGLLQELIPDLDIGKIQIRILLYYYLYHKDVYGYTNEFSDEFMKLTTRGYMDISEGRYISLPASTMEIGDYIGLIRDSLETIYMDDSWDVMHSLCTQISVLKNLNTVYLLDGISISPYPERSNLDESAAEIVTADKDRGRLPRDIAVLRIKRPNRRRSRRVR